MSTASAPKKPEPSPPSSTSKSPANTSKSPANGAAKLPGNASKTPPNAPKSSTNASKSPANATKPKAKVPLERPKPRVPKLVKGEGIWSGMKPEWKAYYQKQISKDMANPTTRPWRKRMMKFTIRERRLNSVKEKDLGIRSSNTDETVAVMKPEDIKKSEVEVSGFSKGEHLKSTECLSSKKRKRSELEGGLVDVKDAKRKVKDATSTITAARRTLAAAMASRQSVRRSKKIMRGRVAGKIIARPAPPLFYDDSSTLDAASKGESGNLSATGTVENKSGAQNGTFESN